MSKIKSVILNALFAISFISLGLSLQSGTPTAKADPEWLSTRTSQQMKEPIPGIPSSATWLGTEYMTPGVDNMGNTTTCRVRIVAGTEYMYFNSGYKMMFTIKGNGRQTSALSSITTSPSGGQFFDAFVVGNNVSAMIESDGCVEVSYRYFGTRYPGPFIVATASFSMFK